MVNCLHVFPPLMIIYNSRAFFLVNFTHCFFVVIFQNIKICPNCIKICPIGKIPIGILFEILIGIFPIGIFPIGIPIGIPLGKIPIGKISIGIFPTGISIEI